MITITSQPAANSLNSAYRPVLFLVSVPANTPIAFCDVYFNNVFYKTLSASLPETSTTFDIQNPAQEYLKKFLTSNGGSSIVPAAPLIVIVECRFRGSSLDSNGLTVVDPTIPIQATGNTTAVAGTGTGSNTFYMLNATLQQEANQDFPSHLDNFKKGTWGNTTWPLSHRKDGYKVLTARRIGGTSGTPGSGAITGMHIGATGFAMTDGSYTDVSLTGSVSGATGTVNLIVSSGAVIGMAVNNPGVNYAVGESLTIAVIAEAGGTGSGAQFIVDSVEAGTPGTFDLEWKLGSDYFPIVTDQIPSCIEVFVTYEDGTTGGDDDCGLFPDCPEISIDDGSGLVDNGDGTFTYTLIWTTPAVGTIVLRYRIDGSSDAFNSVSVSASSLSLTFTAALGQYEVIVDSNGSCNTVSTAIGPLGIDPPDCVPTSISAVDLPQAITSTPYSVDIPFTGDLPATISAITKPSWMTVTSVGSNIQLRGTPALADEATGVTVGFTLTNACGSDSFSDTINVLVLERTLTFTLGAPHSVSPMFVSQLNNPVDVDVTTNTIFADGFAAGDCSAPVVASMTANNFTIPSGGYAASLAGTPGGSIWTSLNSFSLYGIFITVAGGYSGAVFPGDVIIMGSYSVTILFDGC